MMFQSNDVKMSTGVGGIGRGFSAMISGESLVKNTYTNEGGETGYIGLTSNYPFSELIPIPFGALADGTINLPVSSVHALDDITDAVRASGEAGRVGKVLLRP